MKNKRTVAEWSFRRIAVFKAGSPRNQLAIRKEESSLEEMTNSQISQPQTGEGRGGQEVEGRRNGLATADGPPPLSHCGQLVTLATGGIPFIEEEPRNRKTPWSQMAPSAARI